MGNLSTIFPKNGWQFLNNKEKKPVESNDYLCPDGT